ncbi:protein L [Isoptericola jiangsuensis]|uniref:protein L n=1 Tax=Isoptericola jiangsuensis TaxID=548579 RepID=UPI003865551E
MAWYTTHSILQIDTPSQGWSRVYGPAEKVELSGIYRCLGCGLEVTCNKGDPFPPQPKHSHSDAQGDIRWKLNIRTNTDGT